MGGEHCPQMSIASMKPSAMRPSCMWAISASTALCHSDWAPDRQCLIGNDVGIALGERHENETADAILGSRDAAQGELFQGDAMGDGATQAVG